MRKGMRWVLMALAVAGLATVPAACGDPTGPGGPVEREQKDDPGKDQTGGASALVVESFGLA